MKLSTHNKYTGVSLPARAFGIALSSFDIYSCLDELSTLSFLCIYWSINPSVKVKSFFGLRFIMISVTFGNLLNLFSPVQDTSRILQVPSSSLSLLSSLNIPTWLSRSSNAYLFLASLNQSPTANQILLYLSILSLPFLVCYLKTWQSFVAQCSDTAPIREPPTVPYMIPFFGRIVDSIINIRKFFHGLK